MMFINTGEISQMLGYVITGDDAMADKDEVQFDDELEDDVDEELEEDEEDEEEKEVLDGEAA